MRRPVQLASRYAAPVQAAWMQCCDVGLAHLQLRTRSKERLLLASGPPCRISFNKVASFQTETA